MAYDPKCHDLADAFLEDHPHLWTQVRTMALAQRIQRTIDEFIADEQDNFEPADPPGFEAGFADNH